jgi:hypothetical protein
MRLAQPISAGLWTRDKISLPACEAHTGAIERSLILLDPLLQKAQRPFGAVRSLRGRASWRAVSRRPLMGSASAERLKGF